MRKTTSTHLVPPSSLCGIDEAGRGALAGPLVAAAVQTTIPLSSIETLSKSPVRDSKTLSEAQRERIFSAMQKLPIFILTETISTNDINEKGIGWANKEAMKRLIIRSSATHYILDGKLSLGVIPNKQAEIESVVDADATIPQVILAGIAAKVTRDHIMHLLHQEFPNYEWNMNKGYGTKRHIQALEKFSSCCHHRTIFVQTALSKH